MSWAKLDDGMWSHPKFLDLSNGAVGVWAKGLSWCAQQLSDGAIPRALQAMFRATAAEVAEIVEAGLWDETPGGWQVHDYLEFNPSRESVLAERDKGKVRAQRSYAKRKEQVDSSPEETPNLRPFFAESSPDPSRPVPTRPENSNQISSSRITEPSVQADPETALRRREDLAGFHWYVAALGTLPTSAPALESFRRQYGWIGSKPDAERAVVAKAIQSDPWCQANKHIVDPEHVRKRWQRYLHGDAKPVLKPVVAPQSRYRDLSRAAGGE